MKKTIKVLQKFLEKLPQNQASVRFLAAVGAFFLGCSTRAFDFSESDLLVGLRQPSGNYEMVVNLGRATSFATFARSNPGGTLTITNYSASMLSSAFSDLGDIHWSVFASVVAIGQVDPPYAGIWVTRPRESLATQTTPWYRRLAFSQSGMASAVSSVGNGAKSAPGSTDPNAVVLDAGVSYGYAARVGPLGDFAGKWLGVVEGVTPPDFVSSEGVNRIDLYYVPPDPSNSKAPGEYLGYFDFKWDGTMTFTAAGGATLPAPTLTNVSPPSAAAGASIILTGSHFAAGTKVFFGGVMATSVTVNSDTSITAVTPPHDPGTVDVVVTNTDQQSATLAGGFTYTSPVPPPAQIVSFSNTAGLLRIITSGATNLSEIVLTASTVDAAAWTPVTTNIVGSDGLFTNSIPMTGAAGFVRIKIP